MTVLVAGDKSIGKKLDFIRKTSIKKFKIGMGVAVQIIKRKSMDNAPVEHGFLKASHRAKVKTTGTKVIGEIHVGGSGYPVTRTITKGKNKGKQVTRVVDYALYVHEIPAQHKAGKTDKFLEKALKSEKKKVLKELKKMKLVK